MDQAEIDALMNKGSKPAATKVPPAKAVAAAKAPAKEPAKPVGAVTPDDPQGHVISELDAVTAVTERETNKVMDQLDLISNLVGKQQGLITGLMQHAGAHQFLFT